MTSPGPWPREAASSRPATLATETRHLPAISIVVTSNNQPEHLRRCLERYAGCWAEARAEIIVVYAGASRALASFADRFPLATWIAADTSTTRGDLRRIGFERSSKDVVLLLDVREAERHEWAAALCRNWYAWADSGGRLVNAPTCGTPSPLSYPYLSVVMPVRNGGPRFSLAVEAMMLSDLPRQSWELVIVDDTSTDETAAAAAQYADKVLRLRHGKRGPGYARNRGFELTLGECVAFVNADVVVDTDTLRNGVTILTGHPEIAAVFGSCCASPRTGGILSEYRSLAQRFYHERNADGATTFSSACGIVRSAVFEKAGGYDEWHFSRRQLEDLELGQRIRALGERIVSHSDIRATHLRRWTLRGMIATEIFDRAVPWMRLVKRQLTHDRGGPQGARAAKNINIALSWLFAICATFAWPTHNRSLGVSAVACLSAILLRNAAQLGYFANARGLGFAAVSIPLDILYYLIAGVGLVFGWLVRQTLGEPTPGAVAEAFTEVGVKRWPPVPVRRVAWWPVEAKSVSLSQLPELAKLPLASREPDSQGPLADNSQPLQ
jgi:hypothetical protein